MPRTVRGVNGAGKGMRCAGRRGELCWRQMCLGKERSVRGCSLFESESRTPERLWGPLKAPRHLSAQTPSAHECCLGVPLDRTCRKKASAASTPRSMGRWHPAGGRVVSASSALRVGGDEATNSGVKALQAAVAQAAATSPAGVILLSCYQPRPLIAFGRAVSLRGRASICRDG
jgi:hypothetical protein